MTNDLHFLSIAVLVVFQIWTCIESLVWHWYDLRCWLGVNYQLSVCHQWINPSIKINVIYLYLSICIYVSMYLSVSIYLPIYIYLYPSIYLSIYLYLFISIYLSIYLSTYLSIYLYILPVDVFPWGGDLSSVTHIRPTLTAKPAPID